MMSLLDGRVGARMVFGVVNYDFGDKYENVCWEEGWREAEGGSKSRFMDCLQQSKN